MPTTPRPKKSKINWSKYLIVLLLGLALVAFILQSIPRGGAGVSRTPPGHSNPRFVDMGDLSILDEDGQQIIEIDIELAQGEEQTSRGLMWRRDMDEKEGMLFLMDSLKPQSFWMLNTYIPLDIIYADENKRVVSIAEDTEPESLDPIPSGAPAQYVLEVNAGFARRHGIREGHQLVW